MSGHTSELHGADWWWENWTIPALAPQSLVKTSLSQWSPRHFLLTYRHLGPSSLRAIPSCRDPALGLGSKNTSWAHMLHSGYRGPSGNGSPDNVCYSAALLLPTYLPSQAIVYIMKRHMYQLLIIACPLFANRTKRLQNDSRTQLPITSNLFVHEIIWKYQLYIYRQVYCIRIASPSLQDVNIKTDCSNKIR